MTNNNYPIKVLILGATGMLGHTLFQQLSRRDALDVQSTARNGKGLGRWFPPELLPRIHTLVNAEDFSSVTQILSKVNPDVVINCIGVIKQLDAAKKQVQCIEINALFPHRLAMACNEISARLIHFSTDCVFSGAQGMYREMDIPDCNDLYGRSKLLGEVNYSNTVTLRTSIVGEELNSNLSLLSWFLSQEGNIRGFTKVMYSGFPAGEMARIIVDYVIPYQVLTGVYHVSSAPISKYDLLCLVREAYGKNIEIVPQADIVCDRSLDSTRFREATGYVPPTWPELVDQMREDYRKTKIHRAQY